MVPLITNASSLSKLEDIKKVIRSLLISLGSRDISLNKLNSFYKEQEDDNIPYKEFNFTSLKDFLLSIPEVLYLEWNDKLQSYCAYHVDTEKSQHISSLVAKEKRDNKQSFSGKNKSRAHLLQEQYNPVDPHLLLEVLKDLCSPKNNKIRKEDILAEIQKRIGNYSFYSMKGLNCQLSEFLHLINYDSDYIYFKDTTLQNNSSLQKTNSKNQNKIINDNKASRKSVNLDSISDFINEKIQERLIKLIENHPNGIWCSELPKLYVKEFGFDLQYLSMGFNSITEFVAALPHIFKIVIPSNTQKQMVVDARRDSNDLLTSNLITSIPLGKSSENVQHDYPPHPSKLSPKVSKSLIPENTMNHDETVDQITVSSLSMSSNSVVDVIVCDVYNPSFFWIMLYKNKKKLNKFMFELHDFYSQQDLNKYKIAKAVLQPGLNIACTFTEMWHRGIVTKINPNGVEIQFYDYGTVSTYNFEEIYHLDKKFATFPAQAIPCGLYNIKPIESNKWPSEYCKKFQKKVFDKAFVASIFNIDEENNSMIINLIDTSSNKELYINEWMIAMKMAKWGKSNCKKNNFAFQHYRECLKITESVTDDKYLSVADDKGLRIEETENKISFISIDLTVSSSPMYMDSKKQLEALKKYKAKLSSSLSSTSLASSASFASEDSASSTTSASSESSITHLINDNSDEKQDKKDSDLSDLSQEKVDIPEFNSKDLSGSQSSLFSTDSFISNASSYKSSLFSSDCSKLMFKSSNESTVCDSRYSSSNRKHRKNNKSTQNIIDSTLKELQKISGCLALGSKKFP